MGSTFRIGEDNIGAPISAGDARKVASYLRSTKTLAFGPVRQEFEGDFARYVGVKHAATVDHCTVALDMAAQLLRLKAGDEVVGSPQTFIATYIGLIRRGVRLRFGDVDPRNLSLDPATIERNITKRTKAIYVVHYAGSPADMDPILQIARKRGLAVVEDAAHATGAAYKGRKIGSLGDATCFSFNSLKNMSTGGEGGMLTTNHSRFAKEFEALRMMGALGPRRKRKVPTLGGYREPKVYDHNNGSYAYDLVRAEEYGMTLRMSELAAFIGCLQLKKLDGFNRERTRVARSYMRAMEGIPTLRFLEPPKGGTCVWHLFPVFLDCPALGIDLRKLLEYLQHVKKIHMIQRYFPIHLLSALRAQGHKFGEAPVCERIWFNEQLNFPMNPKMTDKDTAYVADALREGIRKLGR